MWQRGCCSCDPLVRGKVFSVSTSMTGDHQDRVCDTTDPCPACESDPYETLRGRYVPTCSSATRWEGGECHLLDLAQLPCTEDVGCRVRTRSCCECGASVALDNLIAVPTSTSFLEFCDSDVACDGCLPTYPAEVQARCAPSGFCELLVDGTPHSL
jgi:hypothetical protein